MTSSIRRRHIKTMVEELLKEAQIAQPPVPVERLAELRGAIVRRVPFPGDDGEVSGMLYQDGQHTIIGVNQSHFQTRQRFTIAHELGHLLLHPVDHLHLDRDFRVAWRDGRSAQATDIKEIEANQFAAELLMPAFMLRQELEGQTVDIEDDGCIKKLAGQYEVSLQAMIFRLTNLGFIGAAAP